MGKYLILITILALCSANQQQQQHKNVKPEKHRKSYVCPPNFMRLSNKCYFFSNKTATWQDAYWKCRDMHSNIATIKNSNQDRILRKTLDHDTIVPLERWIGGRYDWGTMSWQWGASGKTVQYQGFADKEQQEKNKEELNWHCIIMDPTKHYKWSSRSCIDEKHFICQTKIRVVNGRDKKRLQKHYNNKLNEVAVPEIRTNALGGDAAHQKHPDNNAFSNDAFAVRPKETRIRLKKKKEVVHRTGNGTAVQEASPRQGGKRKHGGYRTRRNKHHGKSRNAQGIEKMKWKTYYEGRKSLDHPRIAVEEFSYR